MSAAKHWPGPPAPARPPRVQPATAGQGSPCRGQPADDRQSDLQQAAARRKPPFHRASDRNDRSEEHTSELQSLMRSPYAVFCLKTKKLTQFTTTHSVIP